MAMVAGHANIGRTAATDLISTQVFKVADPASELDQKIDLLVQFMVTRKSDYWKTTQVPPEQWPGPTLLLAAPGPAEVPRVWRVDLVGEAATKTEILTSPAIKVEGSYDEVFGLLHGIHPEVLNGMGIELNFPAESLWKAFRDMKALRPYDKLELWGMPVQDAIDLAVFLATVQVEMDRFLPGTPACGGPIDVMVLQMAPEPGILAYPGKIIHHPVTRRVN